MANSSSSSIGRLCSSRIGALHVLAEEPAGPDELASLAPELRIKVRDAFLNHADLIDSFVEENPANLSGEELAIVRSWRNLVAGKFYILRELAKHTVFLSTAKPAIAYGVLSLAQPLEELVGPRLPVLIETVLLPFRDKIVYDGLIASYGISFGPGVRRMLNDTFKEAKACHGIVTSLPLSDKPMPPKAPRAKQIAKPRPKDETADVLRVIMGMIEPFCRAHLTDEYARLCRKLAEKLASKRPSPLLSGHPNSWACGIVRTIGWVNFLDDRSQKPHLKLTAIDKAFGVAESTGNGKSMLIRKMLKMTRMHPAWSLRSMIERNPMTWMIEVNGFLLDARFLKREIQEEALRKGLIPYIPERPGRLSAEDEEEGE